MNKDFKSAIIIAIFIFILSLPFLNKAYHIDDTLWLYISDQIIKDPLKPYSFTVDWGNSLRTGSEFLDTPLAMYYIAVISLIFGRSEIILHSSYLIFNIIAGLAFYFIAKKFIKRPLTPTLILLATPTFLVNSQNLMLDVPMLSVSLLAIALFIYGVDKDKHRVLFFGSLAAGFAYLTKPNAIVIIPLMALYSLLKKKPKYAYYQIIPIVFIALFSIHNYIFDNGLFIKNYLPFLFGEKTTNLAILFSFVIANFSYIGGALLFPLFLIYPFVLKKGNLKFLGFSAITSLILSALLFQFSSNFLSGKYTVSQISAFFIFTSSSILFMTILIKANYSNLKLGALNLLNIKKSRYDIDSFFIFVWVVGIFILNSVISGGAVRYNVLFLPPFIISYFTLLRKYSYQFRINFSKLSVIILILTTLTGLAVASADFIYANTYREFANSTAPSYKTNGNKVYFIGSGGYQYYMNDKGYTLLPKNDNSPKTGDIIIKARLAFPRKVNPELAERIELIGTVGYGSKFPLRTHNTAAHAGFYTYAAGFLPYSFSNSNIETFEIYQVKK